MSDKGSESAPRQCWVVKLGSALLTGDGRGLDIESVQGWVDDIVRLQRRGVQVVLVSSGAIAEGMSRLGLSDRPKGLHQLQALAAVGQMGLIQAYERAFLAHGRHTAQVLLTHEDVADRRRYLNARTTLRALLAYGVTPVVNENDTVATNEIRFGDNDTLAGLVANLVEANTLVILTDQAGLYTADPRHTPDAELVREAEAGAPHLQTMAGDGSALGRGGMRSKLSAATLAARCGAATRIASGREPQVLNRLFEGEQVGTYLSPGGAPLAARKQWLAGQVRANGTLHIDDGAVQVLCRSGRSLLAVGVSAVEGEFERGELVTVLSPRGVAVARGLVNYDADEVRRIAGQPSSAIGALLGYEREPELIHRDNLVVLESANDKC